MNIHKFNENIEYINSIICSINKDIKILINTTATILLITAVVLSFIIGFAYR